MAPPRVLILVGGGHSHVQVIKNFNHAHRSSLKVILISDSSHSVYSGMLPAVVAGLCPEEKSLVNLPVLCASNDIHFLNASVTRIRPSQNRIFFRPSAAKDSIECSLVYDTLSINVGSRTRPLQPTLNHAAIPPDDDTSEIPVILHTRPIAKLAPSVRRFERLMSRNPAAASTRVVVIGAGAAGIELALALDTRLSFVLGQVCVTLVAHGEAFASQFGRMAGNVVLAELKRRRIKQILGRTAISFNRRTGTLILDDASELPFHLAVVATGAAPHTWMPSTNLDLDPQGWLLVRPTLQTRSYDNVFASGDCASFGGAFGFNFPPKAGVYAVRQGPVLTHNLETVLGAPSSSKGLREYVPQSSFLSLLSTGDGRGIGSKYGLVFRGTWVYRLKSYIDDAWQDKFRIQKSKGALQKTSSGPKQVEKLFEGTAAEGAAVLHAADDSRVVDSFEDQLAVLRRMDNDVLFREELLHHVKREIDST